MGLSYLLIGCFFLLNPYFSILDILPDFIGCILILKGLSKGAKISESFADAARQFRYLLIVTAVRICTTPLISDTEEVWPLVITMCFGLAEAYLSVRGFIGIFDGLTYTASSSEDALYTRWRETKQFTLFFLIAKAVLAFLPELTLLSSGDYGVVTPDGVQSLANYRLVFTLMAMLLGLLIGIAWYIQFRKYWKAILRDNHYLAHLERLYQDRYTNVSAVFLADNLRRALLLMSIGMVLSIELIFDGVNYLPHIVGALFMAVAAYRLHTLPGTQWKFAKPTARWALIYGLVSLPRLVYSIIFTQRIFGDYLNAETEGLQFPYVEVLQDHLARDFTTIYGLIALVALSIVESVCMVLFLLYFYRLIKEIFQQHTRASIPPPPVPEGMENVPRPKDELRRTMALYLTVSSDLGLLAALSMIIATAAPAFFPSYWLIDLLIRGAWVISGYLMLSKLREAVEAHYAIVTREDIHPLTH